VTWGNLLWLAALFVVSLVVSLIFVTFLLVRLPHTYFLDSHQRHLWIDQHPVIRWSGRILKNLGGVALILLGGVLSIPGIPGQGALTILIGVILLDFPGKRRLERAILRRPWVGRLVSRLRKRFGRPPFELESTTNVRDTLLGQVADDRDR
jgi:hypothetical protein